MSSRNRFLTSADRATAPLLHRVLRETASAVAGGDAAEPVLEAGRRTLTEGGFAVDYLALVDGPSVVPIETAAPGARLIATARLGSVRLLDNVAVRV
jgi:pantoate--beta-alanine ligase